MGEAARTLPMDRQHVFLLRLRRGLVVVKKENSVLHIFTCGFSAVGWFSKAALAPQLFRLLK